MGTPMTNKSKELIDLLVDDEKLPSSDWLAELSDLDQAGIEFLDEHWENIPPNKRKQLLEALGNLAADDFKLSFDALNRFAIMDSEADVRHLAIRNLWESDDYQLIPTLISNLLDDPSIEVRASAAKALGPFILKGETDSYPRQFLVDAEEALLNSLRRESAMLIQCGCIESLGYSSREEVDQIILDAYNSEDEDLIQSALLAMGRSADEHWAETISRHLHSQSPALRNKSAVAAGELEIREAIPELIELLDDVNPLVRRAATWSISQIGGSSATRALSSLMDSADDEEIELLFLQDALDNLDFTNSTRDMVPSDSIAGQELGT